MNHKETKDNKRLTQIKPQGKKEAYTRPLLQSGCLRTAIVSLLINRKVKEKRKEAIFRHCERSKACLRLEGNLFLEPQRNKRLTQSKGEAYTRPLLQSGCLRTAIVSLLINRKVVEKRKGAYPVITLERLKHFAIPLWRG